MQEAYGHTTTAMHGMSTPSLNPPQSDALEASFLSSPSFVSDRAPNGVELQYPVYGTQGDTPPPSDACDGGNATPYIFLGSLLEEPYTPAVG